MSTYIASHRAIVDARRVANAKALSDFQSALNSATTDAQLQAAKDARKAAVTAANATAAASLAALVKPAKPIKPTNINPRTTKLMNRLLIRRWARLSCWRAYLARASSRSRFEGTIHHPTVP